MKNQGNLLDALFELRDRYREQAERGVKIVRADELPWEINRHGKMCWYVHPAKNDTAIRSLVIYRLCGCERQEAYLDEGRLRRAADSVAAGRIPIFQHRQKESRALHRGDAESLRSAGGRYGDAL